MRDRIGEWRVCSDTRRGKRVRVRTLPSSDAAALKVLGVDGLEHLHQLLADQAHLFRRQQHLASLLLRLCSRTAAIDMSS